MNRINIGFMKTVSKNWFVSLQAPKQVNILLFWCTSQHLLLLEFLISKHRSCRHSFIYITIKFINTYRFARNKNAGFPCISGGFSLFTRFWNWKGKNRNLPWNWKKIIHMIPVLECHWKIYLKIGKAFSRKKSAGRFFLRFHCMEQIHALIFFCFLPIPAFLNADFHILCQIPQNPATTISPDTTARTHYSLCK